MISSLILPNAYFKIEFDYPKLLHKFMAFSPSNLMLIPPQYPKIWDAGAMFSKKEKEVLT